MSSALPPPYEHPGSPPARPELPDGVIRPEPPERPDGRLPAGRGDGAVRWPAWAPFAALLLTLGLALVGATLLGLVVALVDGVDLSSPPPGVTIGGTVMQDLALVVSAVVLAWLTAGRPTPAQFGVRLPRLGPAVGWTLVTWLSFFVFSAIWAAALGITQEDDLPQELGADESAAALVGVTILVTVIAPITEEFFFRGFLFGTLRGWIGTIGGGVVTGVVFGAIHFAGTDLEFLVPLAFLGFMLCLLYHWTGSLLPCMVLHALNNSLALGVSMDWDWQVPVLMLGSSAVILALSVWAMRSRRLGSGVAPA